MAKTGTYQIPFDENGNQQHYPDDWRHKITWEDNHEFDDTLTFIGYNRGRSAANFDFRRGDGRKVTFFLKEFEEIVPHMVHGEVAGTFTFIKRGQNYGTRMTAVALRAP